MRALVVRTLAFLVVVGVPTIVFDLVYWQAPWPGGLRGPVEVALRLTLVAFLTALVERAKLGGATPLAVFVMAVLAYGFGYAEAEYVKGLQSGHTPEAGLIALSALEKRAIEHPRYFPLLLAIVAIPFAASSTTRVRKLSFGQATAICFIATFVLVVLLLEPFHNEVGRPAAAFVCLRTIFVGLLLPVVDHLADRYSGPPRIKLIQQPPE